jgi:hypothetical protein
MRLVLACLLCFLLVACGGAGAAPSADTTPLPDPPEGGDPPPVDPPPNPGPEVALLLVSGHSFGTVPNYLATATGPFLESALLADGYTVETSYFTDDPGTGLPGAYLDLLAKLQAIQDDWIEGRSDPTRIVIVPHSHGGVRAHAAIRAKPGVTVRLLADLDTSSNGWALVHPGEDTELGGSPVDAHVITGAAGCPDFPLVPNEAGDVFDVEDVVFDNVVEAFEVRTGDIVFNPLQLEYYDERWNVRLDGTQRGLTCWYSGTNHSEPTLPGGVTLPRVRDWILERLASDS